MAIDLNEEQKDIVYYDNAQPGNKPFLSIEAGPGAGKTRVIIEKVKHMVNSLNVDPESLLIITFSNKAAEELNERLAEGELSKSVVQKMQISTIHSFCIKLLEENGSVGFDVIADENGEKVNMFVGKHLKDLGFVNEYYIPNSQISDIIKKYDEYVSFNVDTDKLVDYIQKTRPINPDYVEFVHDYMEKNDGKFPRREVMEDDMLKQSWYNARYLQIARSYPIYRQLLEKLNATDFGQMQIRALEILEENNDVKYKNILVDEFQDTDPVQMQIFDRLMEHAESFTVVGDINQSIYGFRGATENPFKVLREKYPDEFEFKSLSTNYRSTHEIINISEDFIKHQRDPDSPLGKADCGRKVSNHNYYMVNEDNDAEALNIFKIIRYLIDTGKVNGPSDIGILTRSVRGKRVSKLIELLDDYNDTHEDKIPYQIRGLSDLIKKDEIKSILTLMYHLVQDGNPHNHIMNRWNFDWLNLKAYTGANFNQVLFDLSDETKDILNALQDKFEEDIKNAEKDVYFEFTDKKSRLRSFSGVFNRDEEIVKEVFNRVERPILTDENLRIYGVSDENDLEFFKKLNGLRYEVSSDEVDFFDRPTVSEVYLRLLTDVTGYLTVEEVTDHEDAAHNLSGITRTLSNFEEMRYERDFRGLFWFIYRTIEGYDAYAGENKGVQIMTVHKSKGLEFPVVIIPSLKDNGFPLAFKDPNPDNGFIRGAGYAYYTPYDCLRYPKFSIAEGELDGLSEEEIENVIRQKEEKAHFDEEERVIYVAMTRAEDVLILSSIVKDCEASRETALKRPDDLELCRAMTKGPTCIQEPLNENIGKNHHLIDPSNIEIETLPRDAENEEDKIVDLSFTALQNYLECPFKYKLAHVLNFDVSQKREIDDGIFIHKALEIINKRIKANGNEYIGNDEVSKTVEELFEKSNIMLKEEKPDKYAEKLKSITHDVIHYYENEGANLKIIESEYAFYLKDKDYGFQGVIDLIYEKDGKLGIIDYKNTNFKGDYKEEYDKQLHLYLMALRDENQEYFGHNIEELNVYTLKSKKLIPFEIDEGRIDEIRQQLQDVALKIKNNEFEPDCEDCSDCPYKKICGKE